MFDSFEGHSQGEPDNHKLACISFFLKRDNIYENVLNISDNSIF